MEDFDPKGKYGNVVDAVRKASDGGKVAVFRVPHGRTRAEYFVVGFEAERARIVGFKALAVES